MRQRLIGARGAEGPRGREAGTYAAGGRRRPAVSAGAGPGRAGAGRPLTPYTRSSGQLTGIFNLGVNNKTDV